MPGLLTPAGVRAQIAAGTPEPLYLITGDDEAEMSALGSALVDSVDEDFRAFNVQRFYGNDAGTTIAAILDAASTLPLLSARRVVVLSQAEKVLAARRGRAAEAEAEDESESGEPGGKLQLGQVKEYAKHPHAHAVVALIGTGLERTFSALAKQAAVVVCEASADVIRQLEMEHGVRFERDAADLLRQMAGADVARLRADVERVLLYAAGRASIGREQVQAVAGRAASAGAGNFWKALADRRTASALEELELEMAEGAVPFMILGLVRSVVERTVAPRHMKAALDALLRTDLALKTSGGDPRVLLERLIVEVCATGRN